MSRTTQPENRNRLPLWWGGTMADLFARGRVLPPLSLLFALAVGEVRSAEAPVASATKVWAVAAEASLRAACGCDSARVEWNLSPALAGEIARWDNVEFRSLGRTPAPDGGSALAKFELRGLQAGRPKQSTVEAAVACRREAWVLAKATTIGADLSGAEIRRQLTWTAPEVPAISGAGGENPLPPSGIARRSLAAGTALSPSDVAAAPLVASGEWVRLIYRGAGLEVAGRAQVRSDGWLDDEVALRLEGARRDCRGRVIAPGTVLMESPAVRTGGTE